MACNVITNKWMKPIRQEMQELGSDEKKEDAAKRLELAKAMSLNAMCDGVTGKKLKEEAIKVVK
eukprot:1338528-Amphidinium_carterae.1